VSPRRSPGLLRRGVASIRSGGRGAATSGKTRALGQHFLRDPEIAGRIVDLAAPTARDLVVEIGPGEGALTRLLTRSGARVIAVEVDAALARRLRDGVDPRAPTGPGADGTAGGAGTLEVIEADARWFDYGGLAPRRPQPAGRVLIVGNLPYSVGTAILVQLIAASSGIDEMVLMLQKEVAERVAAVPGSRSYGSLSVLAQIACDVRLVFAVPPGAFRPAPRVDSAVIKLRSRPEPAVPIADRARFEQVVRAAFSQRRKTLANALAGGLGLAAGRAREAIAAASIEPGRRAETLNLAEFARLAACLPGGQTSSERSATPR
jgi:16S rRNA (adenine1518-N6/adenine1519-N6)-dimethyltransferase